MLISNDINHLNGWWWSVWGEECCNGNAWM